MELLGTTRLRTTAYHPFANGIIERFHRQLKAALKGYPNPTHWVDSLPMVLLGIRTALKTDLGCSAAELVYGTTLRIPGEFFVSDQPTQSNQAEFILQLKTAMSNLKAVPTHVDSTHRKVHVSHHLSTCTHVFVRHDAVRNPLQVPYDGPYISVTTF